MTGRDWFTVGVRLLGAWVLWLALEYFIAYLGQRLDFLERLPQGQSPHYYLYLTACYLAVACYFLFGTRHLARLCYGEEPRPPMVPADSEKTEIHKAL